ncbi:hypothetical protein Csa_011866, partial [Cucumis sativus]
MPKPSPPTASSPSLSSSFASHRLPVSMPLYVIRSPVVVRCTQSPSRSMSLSSSRSRAGVLSVKPAFLRPPQASCQSPKDMASTSYRPGLNQA